MVLTVLTVFWSRVCIEMGDGPGELRGNHKLFWGAQWRTMETDLNSLCKAKAAKICKPGLLTSELMWGSESSRHIHGVVSLCQV